MDSHYKKGAMTTMQRPLTEKTKVRLDSTSAAPSICIYNNVYYRESHKKERVVEEGETIKYRICVYIRGRGLIKPTDRPNF